MDEPEPVAPAGGELSDLPLPVVLQIDRLADAYEDALNEGHTPDIEDYVRRLDGADERASVTLRGLLASLQHELSSEVGLKDTSRRLVAGGSDTARREGAELTPTIGPPLPQPSPDGKDAPVVGDYRLLERLGSGGMGVVFKAFHTRLHCDVAIKFPRYAVELDPSHTARLLREAKVVGQLRHEHIVRALDAGDSPYGPYLVTEYIAGETVGDRVRREGPLPIDEALELTRQAADALAYSHETGIVHRDIKPSNLLLDEEGGLRVVDFGLAKPQPDAQSSDDSAGSWEATQSLTFLGTAAYAAPEQLYPGADVDHRADIYALGCVLFFLLTGKPPHRVSFQERLLTDRDAIGPLLAATVPGVPVHVDQVWRRMVGRRPESRFADMAEVEQALVAAAANPGPKHSSVAARSKLLAGTGLVAALAVGALTFGFGRGTSDAPPTPVGPEPPAAVAPFDAGAAKQFQDQWAEHLQRPVRVENSIGMPLVLVPPGEFVMGSDNDPPPPESEKESWRYEAIDFQEGQAPHRVVLTRPIYFGATEVTFAQFKAFSEASGYETDAERTSGWGKEDRGWLKRPGYSWKNTGQRVSEDDFPVTNVTWNDAVALCRWLTENDGLGRYRLPTEAEWEHACRAGTTTRYFFGDDPGPMGDYACYEDNFGAWVHSVADKLPNPFGLYDVYGNRQEWCADVFAIDYYERSPLTDPLCESGGDLRSLRGGTHTDPTWFISSARRWGQEADNIGAAGIRVVCEIPLAE